ncbi:uncharacterized protein TNCV_4215671 [Trichonephila clavipes]|nr:uncharacterized protein TNCV_4215671 [Trichonephila clavipes]
MNRCPDLVVCLKRDLQCLRPEASLVLIYRPNVAEMKDRVDLAQPVNRTPDLWCGNTTRSYSVLCEVNDAQNYLQTEGLNIHQCAQNIRALQTVLEAKLEEFVNDALIYAKSLYEEFENLLNPQDESGGSIYLATEFVHAFVQDINKDVHVFVQDINKEEFQLERVRLQAFVATTEPDCKKETH